MARTRAAFSVDVGGEDITSAFDPIATSITMSLNGGSTADTASVSISDDNGAVLLPPIGEYITIGIGWSSPVVMFEGTIVDIESGGNRGSGRNLTISANSADNAHGKLKGRRHKHKDDATLGEVAQAWGSDSGLDSVLVHESLASIKRAYWGMHNESFPTWAMRIAQQYGATFKVLGKRGVIVPRSAGVSASGKTLSVVRATWGDNIIDWNIKPKVGRPQHKTFKAKHFDVPTATWKWEGEDASYDTDTEAEHTATFSESDEDTAKHRGKSNMLESDRERGTGSVTIDGDPTAQPEAECIVSGARPGVDGSYRIDTATHTLNRGGGWIVSCALKQPDGGAGTDTRQSTKAATPDTPATYGGNATGADTGMTEANRAYVADPATRAAAEQ